MNELPKYTGNTGPSAKVYIKKNCPKYNEDKIIVLPKLGYSTYAFVILVKEKLVKIEFSSHDFHIIIPKLNSYFDNGEWDESYYVQAYTNIAIGQGYGKEDYRDVGPVIKFKNREEYQNNIRTLREQNFVGVDVGFKEVAPTQNFQVFPV